MFGSIGPTELILIFIIALLVFGPKKLPEIGKSVGKAIREFKKTSEEIKGRIEEEIEASEIKDVRKDLRTAEQPRDGIRGSPTHRDDRPQERDQGHRWSRHGTDIPPKTGNTAKDEAQHETGEGPKVSG